MKSKRLPDPNERPHKMTLERQMKAEAEALYQAWSQRFDLWFAEPGDLEMKPEVDAPYFFYNRHDWGRHAHYGRFLELEENKTVEMTWLTGKGGTFGAETVVRIELLPNDEGTMMRFTHSGFESQEHADAHKAAWPEAFDILEQALSKQH